METGAFGKEAYILTGYFNLPKILELALHDGLDPRTGRQLGPHAGDPRTFATFDELFGAWETQVHWFVDLTIRANHLIEQLYAREMPAPFLLLLTSDCIERGLDYNAAGARYNTSYLQGVRIGTLTDRLAAIKTYVYDERNVRMGELLDALGVDFAGHEVLRQRLRNRAPKWGNDDAAADNPIAMAFDAFVRAVDGPPNGRGGSYGVDMLPTTSHVYFGSVMRATPDGRATGTPLSGGISPSQGMGRLGPTAVIRSMAKMDHAWTCGTLLNIEVQPQPAGGRGRHREARAACPHVRSLGGHHVQFNVVSAATLRAAQATPDEYCDLIVRVAGYSDYFCDLSRALQDEIIARTEHEAL